MRINAESASGTSSGLIRDQRVFNPGDLVFEQQFALLEALEHQLIGPDIGLQALDRRIQVAVLDRNVDHRAFRRIVDEELEALLPSLPPPSAAEGDDTPTTPDSAE